MLRPRMFRWLGEDEGQVAVGHAEPLGHDLQVCVDGREGTLLHETNARPMHGTARCREGIQQWASC